MTSGNAPTETEEAWGATLEAEEREAELDSSGRFRDGLRAAAKAHDLANGAHLRICNHQQAEYHAQAALLLLDEMHVIFQVGHVLPQEFFTRPVASTRVRLASGAVQSAEGGAAANGSTDWP